MRALLRPVPVLVALAAVLGGCGTGAGPARYGGGGGYYGGPGYYGSPYYGGRYDYGPYGGYNRYSGSRGSYRGDGFRSPSPPRNDGWSQDRLRQHWLDQARRPR